jgi:exosome complex RNA-binding protein Csl4
MEGIRHSITVSYYHENNYYLTTVGPQLGDIYSLCVSAGTLSYENGDIRPLFHYISQN